MSKVQRTGTTTRARVTLEVTFDGTPDGIEGAKLPSVAELAEHLEAVLVQRDGVADARTVRVERKAVRS